MIAPRQPAAIAPRRRRPDPRVSEIRPWHPESYSTDDVYALQALALGTASAGQQVRALIHIIQRICGTDQPTFVADSDRETVFADGKRHVGLRIRALIALPPSIVKAMRDNEQSAHQGIEHG